MTVRNDRKDTDIRITKTVTTLFESLYMLLQHFDFKQITVANLCAEAYVCRATFYAHFDDKYDLLTKWLITLISETMVRDDVYDENEDVIIQVVVENRRVIKNIIDNADRDTLRALYEATRFILYMDTKENTDGKKNANVAVSENLIIGGSTCDISLPLCDCGLPDVTPHYIHLYTNGENSRRYDSWVTKSRRLTQ